MFVIKALLYAVLRFSSKNNLESKKIVLKDNSHTLSLVEKKDHSPQWTHGKKTSIAGSCLRRKFSDFRWNEG
jgi:hypothetical protein